MQLLTMWSCDYGSRCPNTLLQHLWIIGQELASRATDKLCGVSNVENSHWVGVVIDQFRSLVLYGDSLGGSDSKLKLAIDWWIQHHIDQPFKHQNLPITPQVDGYNCSVLAINAIGCDALPWQLGLPASSDSDELQIAAFNCAISCDWKLVCVV